MPHDALLAFLQRAAPGAHMLDERSWPHGLSRAWRLHSPGGPLILKTQRQPAHYARERHALTHWAPGLGARSTQLLAHDDATHALLLSAMPGTLAQNTTLTPTQERELHRQAGTNLARLHAQPLMDDERFDFSAALQARWLDWSGRARQARLVSDDDLAWVAARVVQVQQTGPWTLTPAHRDYSPRNWMVDLTGGQVRTTVIDFGAARPQVPVLDLERLHQEIWPARPDLRAAFLHGYGRARTPREWALLDAMGALNAVTTIVWAREHHDPAFEARYRTLLRRLRAQPEPR